MRMAVTEQLRLLGSYAAGKTQREPGGDGAHLLGGYRPASLLCIASQTALSEH